MILQSDEMGPKMLGRSIHTLRLFNLVISEAGGDSQRVELVVVNALVKLLGDVHALLL